MLLYKIVFKNASVFLHKLVNFLKLLLFYCIQLFILSFSCFFSALFLSLRHGQAVTPPSSEGGYEEYVLFFSLPPSRASRDTSLVRGRLKDRYVSTKQQFATSQSASLSFTSWTRPHRRREVSLTRVGEEYDDVFAFVFRATGKDGRRMDCRARGDADEDAFGMGEYSADGKSVYVVDGENFVIDGGVERVGDEACADALELMRSRLTAREDGRGMRFYADDFYVGVPLFEVCARTADGTARADACNEDVYLAVGVLPDLGACGLDMCRGVGRVGELAREEAAFDGAREFFCLGAVPPWL